MAHELNWIVAKNEVEFDCPICQSTVYFKNTNILAVEGCTTDCINCGGLLIIKEKMAHDFHAYLNKRDNRWPKDGKGTGYIEI